MAGGFAGGGSGGAEYEGKVTTFVIMTCLVAATGGLLFGYDIGISGGVTSMDEFLLKFFPNVYHKEKALKAGGNQYCKFDDHMLQLFTSSLYLAALVASFAASLTTKTFGRKVSMLTGGLIFLVGAVLNGAAMNLAMLIIGRLLLGALNVCFQMAVTIGILIANLVNYGTSHMKKNGWRVSLVLAVVPAIIMTVGAIFLPDTPNSLIDRGQKEKAKTMLQKIRGSNNVDNEFEDLIIASDMSKQVENPWRNILQPRYRPQFTIAVLIPFFQQLTGINVIMFYAPVLFKTLGFGDGAALMTAVITGLVNVFATLISIFTVDRFGRRALFIIGGLIMIVCQVAVGAIIASVFGMNGQGTFSKGLGNGTVGLICIYVAAFAWSWGPLGWLVPSEVFPMEIDRGAINSDLRQYVLHLCDRPALPYNAL
ncbi:hypothetical protein K7X08_026101 [Anisodus acutangulus]|uniref:Major facilitator superfamily (MFS) profile domain-containing protein n=1 Tax=Anisodus acutangulus TaxID=402998 RepID=A0A9Q1RVI4_9SOLA|nr:hypothetical protein K7X08_026101 [Anisodus acutangulus]